MPTKDSAGGKTRHNLLTQWSRPSWKQQTLIKPNMAQLDACAAKTSASYVILFEEDSVTVLWTKDLPHRTVWFDFSGLSVCYQRVSIMLADCETIDIVASVCCSNISSSLTLSAPWSLFPCAFIYQHFAGYLIWLGTSDAASLLFWGR